MKTLILLAIISLNAYAQEITYGSNACTMKESEEKSHMSSTRSEWDLKGESSNCVDDVGEQFAECLGSGMSDINCQNANIDQSESDIADEIENNNIKRPKDIVKNTQDYGINGSVRALVNRHLNESNCIRIREHCIQNMMATTGSSCTAAGAPNYKSEVFGYISTYQTCMKNTAKSIEDGAVALVYPKSATGEKLEGIQDKSRAIGANDSIECDDTKGYHYCSYNIKNMNPNLAVVEPPNPTPADPMPDLSPPPVQHGQPIAAPLAKAAVPNTCPGTILGDGVTVITSPTCQVMQNNPQMLIQSVNSTGQKVSLPATCDASGTSNVGDSVQCKLQTTQTAKPLYLLETNNDLKTCQTNGWVMSCPESFIEQSLQRRVKVLGVAGTPPVTKPEDGYVHYNRRTGQISTASVGQGVNSNGVMLEFQGKPVIAHTRQPASALMPTGNAYAVDKFVVQTSKTGLSPELLQQGLPLMREISLGDR